MSERLKQLSKLVVSTFEQASGNLDKLPNVPAFLYATCLGVALDTLVDGGKDGLKVIQEKGIDYALSALPLTDHVRQQYKSKDRMTLFPRQNGYEEQRDLIINSVRKLVNDDPIIQEKLPGINPLDQVAQVIQGEDPTNFSLSVGTDITGLFEKPAFKTKINSHAGRDMVSVGIITRSPDLMPILNSLIKGVSPNIQTDYEIFYEGNYAISHKNGKTEVIKY